MGKNVFPFSTFVVKVASRCNLNCTYCYMYNLQDQTYRSQPKRMDLRVARKMAERIRSHAQAHDSQAVHIILHGGEPMLLGMEYTREWLEVVRRGVGPSLKAFFSMQTNGLLVTDEWIDFLADQKVGVGISYDGPKHAHDRYRVHHDGRGSHDEVVAAIERLKRHPRGHEIFSTVLSVVNVNLDPREVWADFKSLGIYAFDVLLPHSNHSHEPPQGGWSYRDWLITLFDLWFDDPTPHGLRYFENIIRCLLRYPFSTDNIGGKPVGVLVIETNGDYEGTDALKCTAEGLSKLGRNVMTDEIDSLYENPFVTRIQQADVPLCETCRACRASEVCGGGYIPHRYSAEVRGVLRPGFENPTIYCDAIYGLVEHAYNRVRGSLPAGWLEQTARARESELEEAAAV
ncbi:MAG TPA: radical SAM protein [Pyrinomonadaceae bacterium]